MSETANPAPAHKSRTSERTFVLGYLAAVTVAWLTFTGGEMVWRGDVVSRYDVGLVGIIATFAVPITSIFLVTPFALVRYILGARAFSLAWAAGIIGAAVGLLSMPIVFGIGRIFDIEGGPASRSDFALTLAHWPLFAGAGLFAGLAYWFVEFSRFPAAVLGLFDDVRPVRWTGGVLSRRAAFGLVAGIALAAGVPAVRWWWRPHVHQPVAANVPRIAFETEWKTRGWIGALAWSGDSTRLTSLSANGDWLLERNPETNAREERKIELLDPLRAIASDRFIVSPKQHGSWNAFDVLSAKTGDVLHEEPDPVPHISGRTVTLSLAPDGDTLAIGYGKRPDLPISLLSTRDWRVKSTLNPEFDRLIGISVLRLSNHGHLLAVGGSRELLVCDVTSGAVLKRIPIWATAVAFSPDDTELAVAETPVLHKGWYQRVHIIQLPDDEEIVSRDMGYGLSPSLLWDPRGRFIALAAVGSDTVHLWDPAGPIGPDVTISLRKLSRGLALSPDGRRLAVANDDVVSVFAVGE